MNKQNRSTKKKINQTTRVVVLFGIAALVVLLFIARLAQLQLIGGKTYRKNAIAQRRRTVELAPKRGAIYDRNQNPLALSVTVNTCFIYPNEIEDVQEATQLFSHILGLEVSTVRAAIESGKDSVRLKTQISQSEIDQLKSSGLRAYAIEQEAERFYPNQDILAQTLGFINSEGEGLYGVEAYYDSELKGVSGQRIYSKDLSGHVIPTESTSQVNASAGRNVYLTIDLELQKIVADKLKAGFQKHKPEAVSAILMDPNTGEILAMESYPTFNPNTPRAPIDAHTKSLWNGINEEQRLKKLYELWKNPVISNLYEPGSVFKSLTTAMALETRSSKPDSTYICNGSIEIAPGISIYCYRADDPHGTQTLEEALINSCNPAFVQIVRELGADAFYSYLRSLHIGGRSGVDLPVEPAGLMPESVETMTTTQLSTMGYGHGVSVTPIQMIAAANTVINGGRYIRPHIISKTTDDQNHLIDQYSGDDTAVVFSDETVKLMRQYLVDTVQKSGSPVAKVDRIAVGGKSGTTEKIVDGQYDSNQTIASYWSFFPADAPKYALLVISDYPKTSIFGSVVSGDISLEIINALIDHDKAKIENGEDRQQLITTPELIGRTVGEARKQLDEQGLSLSVYGNMGTQTVIGMQSAKAGELVKKGTTISVEAEAPARVRVPNFLGMSAQQVNEALLNSGLNVSLSGSGKVVKQNYRAEELITSDRQIVLELK